MAEPEPDTPDELRVGSGPFAPRIIRIHVAYDPFVNYAQQQNAVPLIREVVIDNEGEAALEAVSLRVRAEPDLAESVDIPIDRIASGQAHRLSQVDLRLSPARLVNQAEREECELIVEVRCGDEQLHRSVLPLHVLAYAEWAGLQSIPEILAAFALPNHPEIERLLGRAREHLDSATGSPSLDGYQSRDAARTRAMLGAIYQAAADLNLTCVSPPASFERSGQKVRTPDQLVSIGMGTCLDLALLIAAAAEQAGLNPLLVLLDSHAFVGAWLEEESFADAAVDEVTRLTKRVSLDRIEVVEATGLARRPALTFAQAVHAARARLASPEDFAYAIDVRAARKHGIRPLPLRQAEGSHEPVMKVPDEVSAPPTSTSTICGAPGLTGQPPATQPAPQESAPARVERWKTKLLDLSLRNRLLNFAQTKTTVPLLCPDVARLEDFLADGAAFSVLPRPREAESDNADPRNPVLFRAQTGKDLLGEALQADLNQSRLRATLDEKELDRRLVGIDRAARTSLEEGGANTLYLAVGFLKWFESSSSQVERMAPVLLLPLEISRKSVLEAYRVRLADEDARINVTLLQKLKADFGIAARGFEELETDKSGLDVPGILRSMRELVLPLDRWDVVEEAAIGLFSFTKYLMWLDLEKRSGELAKNAVVRHLIETPNEPFSSVGNLPRPEEIDARRSPTSTFCPKDADSSQLCAVHAAADGRTFVLWGPPGTGKSQTITNIIANALGHGKRVLFASEKMAALNVVKARLEGVGLGAFCLELHSNKAQKAKVLAQLQEALDFHASSEPDEWERQGSRLHDLARQLNAQAEALHRPRALGMSAFQGLARLVALSDAPEVKLELGAVDEFDTSRSEQLHDCVESLAAALREIGPPATNAWRGCRLEAWHPALADEESDVVAALSAVSTATEEALAPLEAHLGVRTDELSSAQIEVIGEVCLLLGEAPVTPRALIESAEFDVLRGRAEEWIEDGRSHVSLSTDLVDRWRDSLLDLRLAELRARCARARDSVWPLSWLRGRRACRELLPHATGKLPRYGELVRDLEAAERLREHQDRLESADADARAMWGPIWAGVDTDFDAMEQALSFAGTLRSLSAHAAGTDLAGLRAMRAAWASLVTEGRELLGADGPLSEPLADCREATTHLKAVLARAEAVLALDVDTVWGERSERSFLGRVKNQASRWSERLRDLRSWSTWRRLRGEGKALRLAPLVEAIESGRLQPSDLERAFEHGLYSWWVKGVFAAEPLLARFDGRQHEDLIRKFRNLDILVTEGAHAVVQGRVAKALPRGQHELSGSSSSEMGILQRQLAKRNRHMPIRKLFERAPNLICRLKPCMLMSPLSVAQFLTTDFPRFDMVVFDEASQIPVWDAIGAIARGDELIVVGDPKQLPPTSFFMRATDDEPDEDEVEELDSILDECIGARLPNLHLDWHYRSRHEGLIAFSNHHYYDNRLFTFPAAVEAVEDLGVSLAYVEDGVYDRGKSRANEPEARSVVADVVERLLDPARCRHSIGIVTFSSAQQTLIEDLLDAARRHHPDIEPYFTNEVEEPVFVKNLENVQGDERDVILFSICYGPDRHRNIALNFGPMNRDGGERRLNVAITRAKRQVVVYSSIRGEEIDLARTNAVGMRHLKHFLEYAERGAEVLGRELSLDTTAEWESIFEEQVHRALVARGFDVVPQVGCSGYRVDLAIKDPVAPGRFRLGIECDGAMYHSGKTARDRDRLRHAVLESLGWSLHRIWSTDWWLNPDREVERVVQRFEELGRSNPAGTERGGGDSDVVATRSDLFASSAHMVSTPVASPPPLASRDALVPGGRPYASTPPLGTHGGADAFYASSQTAALRQLAQRVLAQEAPIEFRLLCRRVAEAFGLQRATDRVLERMRHALRPLALIETTVGRSTFVWASHQDPRTYDVVRIQGLGKRDRRNADEIPPEEIANAAAAVLRDQVSMDADDLSREAGRVLGFPRAGANLKARMDLGLGVLLERGCVRRNGSRFVWTGYR